MKPWGPLTSRFADPNRPHRMLSLDGGGIRGVLTLGILEQIERQLAKRSKNPARFRLCHYFDYIAGTSTGAIIAAGLARGFSVNKLIGFYRQKGEAMFDKTAIWKRWKTLYEDEKLAAQLQTTFKPDSTLEPQHLKCLLLVVTRNATTDSPWPISSNPMAKYNDPSRDDCNLHLPLWQLVRASTAAPVYFPPERIKLGSQTFVFVDGGVTPYNNPAFCLYRMATLDEYKLGWPTGEDKLMLVSVGTGAAATEGPDASSGDGNLLGDGRCPAQRSHVRSTSRSGHQLPHGWPLRFRRHDRRRAWRHDPAARQQEDTVERRSGPSFPLCPLQCGSQPEGPRQIGLETLAA